MNDIATALTSSIAKDGQTTPSADLPMGTNKHTGVGNAVARNQYASAGQVQDNALGVLGSVAGTNTITGNLTPAISAYAAGQLIVFSPAGDNTTAATLNVNAVGAISIKKEGGIALFAGDIVSAVPAFVVLNAAKNTFYLLNPQTTTVRSGSATLTLTDGTTAPTVTCTWCRSGNIASLKITSASLTSNTNQFTMTGLPADVIPSSSTGQIAVIGLLDNGVNNYNASCIVQISGTISFLLNGSLAGFTASGTKGLFGPLTISYLLTP